MRLNRFTLSVITMLVVVAAVTALSVLRDAPQSTRYAPELEPAADDWSAGSHETTGGDLADPSVMETQAPLAPLANSVRERQARAAQSAAPSSGEDAEPDENGGSAPSPNPSPAPPPTNLTLEERKAFYWELIEAQDRAVAEAEAAHPMDSDPPQVDKYVALWLELTAEYETAVREKYDVSEAQADAIVEEGIVNRWPMPPLPE